MPATATSPFTRMERMEAHAAYLRARIRESQTSVRYSRQGQCYQPLEPTCANLEMELALRACKTHSMSFEDAFAELRRTA